jgi:hypothetical protein
MKHYRMLGAMLLIVAMASIAPTAFASPRAQTFSASLTPIGGLVQYLPVGKTEWTTVTKVTLINKGDQVRTGDNGLAKLNVVTGMQIDMFPTTLVELNDLVMGQQEDSAMTFSALQSVGTTIITVNQKVKGSDSIQVSTPGFTANIRGTSFTVFVSHNGNTVLIGDDGTVEVRTADGKTFQVGPNGMVFSELDSENAPLTANIEFLQNNVHSTGIEGSLNNADAQAAFRSFLSDFLSSNVDPQVRAFFAQLLGLDSNASAEDIQNALASFNVGNLSLDTFLSSYRSFLQSYLQALSGNPLEESGGNEDVSASCGNNLCELDKNESLITCDRDCFENNALASSAAALNARNNRGGAGGPPAPQPGTGGFGLGQGQGGGVGRNPGAIVRFSGVGGAVCQVTTLADVNLRSVVDGSVIGVVPVNTTLTTDATNNNGYIVNFGATGSVAANFVSKSAGCP